MRIFILGLGYLGVAAIVVAGIFVSLNVSTGPQQQVTGTVQGVTFVQREGPPSKLVAVRLANGDVVHVSASPQLIVQPGEQIKLDIHRRMLTGSRTYAMAARDKQPTLHTEPSLQRGAPAINDP
ncbi:MAG: hypothetical protein AB1443_10270 [Pseudomonadota bacterium]